MKITIATLTPAHVQSSPNNIEASSRASPVAVLRRANPLPRNHAGKMALD